MNLETPRLRLVPASEEHAADFRAMNADPDVMRFFPAPLGDSESDALLARLIGETEAGGMGPFVVLSRETGAFLGLAGLAVPNVPLPFSPCVELGYRFVKAAWGAGYATEASRAAMGDGFGRLAMREIVSFTAEKNLPSQRVMRRLGMQRDAAMDFEHPKVPVGHPLRPHVLYRLDARRHAALRHQKDE